MSKEKLKKLERITFYIMLILLLLTVAALALHMAKKISLGIVGFLSLAALVCSAFHRAFQNRISGKTLFGKKLNEKKQKKKK